MTKAPIEGRDLPSYWATKNPMEDSSEKSGTLQVDTELLARCVEATGA